MVCSAWPPTKFTTPSHLRPASVSVHPQCLQTCTPAPVGSALGNPSSCWHRQDPINHGLITAWHWRENRKHRALGFAQTVTVCMQVLAIDMLSLQAAQRNPTSAKSLPERPWHRISTCVGTQWSICTDLFEPISFSVRVTSEFYLHWTRVTSNVVMVFCLLTCMYGTYRPQARCKALQEPFKSRWSHSDGPTQILFLADWSLMGSRLTPSCSSRRD
jgi:hypothetical protein